MSLAVASPAISDRQGRRTAAPLKADGFPRRVDHPESSQLESRARQTAVLTMMMIAANIAGIISGDRFDRRG
ncbi:MAG: hypothetical protein R3D27_04085 [Hyphomicrobiaceae bacterium]